VSFIGEMQKQNTGFEFVIHRFRPKRILFPAPFSILSKNNYKVYLL